MDDSQLELAVGDTAVFARVSPQDKLRIVQALQRRGQVVAMTGDGVNDSPALKTADIGVAMGVTGTDVAKESAAMVLLDDNFATIVSAVEEGRSIYDNLVRFVKFSLGGNVGKVLVMLAAPLAGIPVAMTPMQLLWLNLITDGLLGLGLGVEPPEINVMRRPPRHPDSPIIGKSAFLRVMLVGMVIALLALGLGLGQRHLAEPGGSWQTLFFSAIGFAQIGQALAMRARGRSPFSVSANPLLSGLVIAAVVLQVTVLYTPVVNKFFGLLPLGPLELFLSGTTGIITFLVVRLEKY
jgi:Ca2+-transporting ATPase